MNGTRFSKWRRWPALHFILLGAALFVLQTRVLTPAGGTGQIPEREPLVVTAQQIDQLRSDYQRETGRAPSAEVVRRLIDDWITDELFFREARAIGLDRGDRAIQFRLSEKMRFIGAKPDATADELYREALALGLDRDDVVVRRILVQKMRLLTKNAITLDDLDDADLAQFFAEHRRDYRQPAVVDLSHVYLSSEKHPNSLDQDARELLQELRTQNVTPQAAVERGDPFPMGHQYRASSEHQLRKIFGADFAKQVFVLKPGEWSGPIHSAYGLHLVWVDKVDTEQVQPLEAVRSRVEQRLLFERREKHLADTLERLRELYGVRIDERG